jgi:orotidine-5'-phosphate decarboxylase
MKRIIAADKSIVPACDVATLDHLRALVKATADLEGIGAYKLGFTLALRYGLPSVVKEIRALCDKPIIYDHQKAGTDIPDTGAPFVAACAEAGVDSIILVPMSGPATQVAWTQAVQDAGLSVIVAGEMTHERFLQSDGGYLSNDSPSRILSLAARMGVRDFVVPGTKPEKITQYRQELEKSLGADFAFYSPGFVAQGGDISEGAKAAGKRFHPIVGRAIYNAGGEELMREAAKSLCEKLLAATP